MSKFQLKSNKRTVVRIYLKRIGLSFFWLYLPVLLLILLGCSSTAAKKTIPEKNSEEIAALQKTVAAQEELLLNLQALTADQLLRNNELEQAIPPRDLLESLQNGFVESREKTRTLDKQVSVLQKQVTAMQEQISLLQKNVNKLEKKLTKYESSSVEFSRNQKQILQGLLSLQAGNPNQAVEYLQNVLKSKKATKLKAEILLAIGNGFLAQGHAKQAASHYGIFLRKYPESRQVPLALYFLAEAMQELGEKEKEKVLWKELIKNYPKSSFAKRAKKRLR